MNLFQNLFGKKQERPQNKYRVAERQQQGVSKEVPELYRKGDVIGGKYEILHTLGKGGFGIVYLVSVRGSGELCAVKTFRDELLANSSARESFKREALVWVNIEEHPFILTARFVDEFSGRLFVQMDYLKPDAAGRVNLIDHLRGAAGPLNPDRVLEWSIQFCMGMEHAGAHGVECHRDIKPANILIDKNGTLKIADFGLATAAEHAVRSAELTSKESNPDGEQNGYTMSMGKGWCGTPGYLAPEVYRGEGAIPQSDVYSFGLVLWQMTTGSLSPPFDVPSRERVADYLRLIYEKQAAERVPNLGGPLAPVIKRCLRFSAPARYKDFEELRMELEMIYESRTGKKITAPVLGEHTAAFWSNKGASLHSIGQFVEAVTCFRRAVEINPRYAVAWSNMGLCLASMKNHKEAIQCFENALKSNLRSTNAWNNKGISLSVMGRHDEAFGCFDQALAINAQNAAAWNNKGNELSLLSRHEEAIRHFDQALTIDSKYAAALRNKADSLEALGRREEAINCYTQALAIYPQYSNAWILKARCLSKLKRHEEAAACYKEAAERNPKDKSVWNKVGIGLGELGQYPAALECYERALKIDGAYADAWYNKALAHDVLNQRHRAIDSFQRFIQLGSERHKQAMQYAESRVRELRRDSPLD